MPSEEGTRKRRYLWERDVGITTPPFQGYENDVHFAIWQREDDKTIGWVAWEVPISLRAIANKDPNLRNIRHAGWGKARYRFGGRAEHIGEYPGSHSERAIFYIIKEECEKAKKYVEPISESMYLECDFDSMQEEHGFEWNVRAGNPDCCNPERRELRRRWEYWISLPPRIWKEPPLPYNMPACYERGLPGPERCRCKMCVSYFP